MTPRADGADEGWGSKETAVRFSLIKTSLKRGRYRWLGVIFAVLLAPDIAQAGDRWETLQAIHMIENPTNSTRIGSRGELGPYQFRPGTWKMHTKKPFKLAANKQEADTVAVKHYEWIKRNLERHGLEASAYRIALAWNAGLSATLRNAVPSSTHRYAERVNAVAEDLKRRQFVREP